LLRLLVAYQTLWDYLDNVSERWPGRGQHDSLHRALVDALDPTASTANYFKYHSVSGDNGYLHTLVRTCQQCCGMLPSYPVVRPVVLRGVARCAVQAVNHDPFQQRREAALKRLAKTEFRDGHSLRWFEFTAAASAYLPHPLLVLACEPALDTETIVRTERAYFPWVSLAIAMLDSYVDQAEDRGAAKHSYIAYYDDAGSATSRLCEIVRRAASEVRALPSGNRHSVVVAAMVAMYLAKADARVPEMRASTRQLLQAAGSVSQLLVPQLRVWRLLRSANVVEWRRRRRLPPGLPLPAPLQTMLFWKSPLAYLELCQRRYGRRFTLRATSHPPLVFLSDPADIKAILATPARLLHAGKGAETIRPLVGDSSFMLCEGDEHLATRRTILPAFHAKIVEQQAEAVAEIARREVEAWPYDTRFALHPRLRALTLQLILHAVFGGSTEADPSRMLTLRNRLLAMLSVTASPMLAEPLLRRGPGRPLWQRFLRERAGVDELLYTLIDERRRAPPCANDVLARFLAAGYGGTTASNKCVRDNVMSIILAGHETTAAELAWTFQLLAHHPRVLARLVGEINRGSSEEYLTATVQEVLRHRPVFLFAIPRTVTRPVEIGGWTYPSGAQLLGCIYLVQHDPVLYSRPDEFYPERFLTTAPTSHSWLPWGGGRKRCPGLHLATLETKTVLRIVLESRTVRPASNRIERPRWRSVIVTPERGSRIVLGRRTRVGMARTPAAQAEVGDREE
jgi:cytochrome P450